MLLNAIRRKWCKIISGIVVIALLFSLIFFLGIKTSTDNIKTDIEGFSVLDQNNPSQGIELSTDGLSVEQFGKYTGEYVEDGSGDVVNDIAAMVVKNQSEEMLQVAEIEVQIDREDTALFRLSNIPPGKSVLVLDQNKLFCDDNADIRYLSDASSWMDEVTMEDECIEIEGKDGRLTVKNMSDQSIELIYVYYKTLADENLYFGGITYRVPVEEIPRNTVVETEAGHYRLKKSEITNIQIIE